MRTSFIDPQGAAADMSFADLRGANVRHDGPLALLMRNTIMPDGHIQGLTLTAGEQLTVRDYPHNDEQRDIRVIVRDSMLMDREATLKLMLKWDEDDPWTPISFASGTAVLLSGRMELSFGAGGVPYLGEDHKGGLTFEMFDWRGASVNGSFAEIITPSGTTWDLSRLYTAGEVTLIPEPASVVVFASAILLLASRDRLRQSYPSATRWV